MAMIDGKEVQRFLFTRYSAFTQQSVTVEVHAFNKDHAIGRLEQKYPYIPRADWDYIQRLEGPQFLGRLGETLRLDPYGVS